MSKQFWAIVAIVVVVIGGAVFIQNRKDSSTGGSTNVASASNHVEGNASTGVKLVEYGDFQCPACFQAEPVTAQVVEKYKDQIEFQFRNFPLTSIHPNAFAASRAAEAASKQGKFWEMHKALYAQQNYLSWAYAGGSVTSTDQNDKFKQYAQNLGLNIEQYEKDFASSAVNSTIQADLAAGRQLEVTGTPTFFLDGKLVASRPQTVADWSKLIDAAIQSKKQ